MNLICLIAQFYVALYPVGGSDGYLNASTFVQAYLAGPFLLALYLGWKIYSWFVFPSHRRMWVAIKDIDIYTGMRDGQKNMISGVEVSPEQRRASIEELQHEKKRGAMGYLAAPLKAIF